MSSSVSSFSLSGWRSYGDRRVRLSVVVVLFALFMANVYDPSGAFRVKYVAAFSAAAFSVWALKHLDLSLREAVVGLLLFGVWPLWALFYGVARNGDVTVGLSQVTPFLFVLPLLTLLPSLDRRTPLRIYYACLLSLAFVGAAAFGVVILFPESGVASKLFDLQAILHEKEGFFGTKTFGQTETQQFYFGSTLFLVPTSVFYLFSGRTVRATVAFLALALAWSKSGMLIVLIFGGIYLLYSLRKEHSRRIDGTRSRWKVYVRAFAPLGILASIVVGILLAYPDFGAYIVDTAGGQSETAQIRIGHLRSVADLFRKHPQYVLIGQGVGVPFYSLGQSEYVQSFEIDHLDAIRKFGLPWTIGYTMLVFYSVWKLASAKDRELRAFGFALLSMYFAAGTNPVLITPLFVMLLTLCYFAQRPGNGRLPEALASLGKRPSPVVPVGKSLVGAD